MGVQEREEVTLSPESAGMVIHEVLDPSFLQSRLEEVRERGPGLLSEDDYERLFADLARAEESPASGAEPSQGRQAFLPRSVGVSVFQSTVNTCILSRFRDLVGRSSRCSYAQFGLDNKNVFRKFGPCDAAWVESVISKELGLFRHRQEFPDGRAPDVAIADDARIVVVGDWGTGLPDAQTVGEQMRKSVVEGREQGRETHVLHLGDVYYSGWKEEYQSRFLPFWPVQSASEETHSWSLNGNHDMYSGGHGYFGFLLREPRFAGQNGSSHFCLANSDWQLLGLDTAFAEPDLAGGQADWVKEKLEGSDRRTMLLSHHQPFSPFAKKPEPAFVKRLQPAFDVRKIDAWLWGHEHLCCVYEKEYKPFLRFGSCIGHGGVPVLHDKGPLPEGVAWRADGFETECEDWQLFGFAVLDFAGSRIDVGYYDQHGTEVETARIE